MYLRLIAFVLQIKKSFRFCEMLKRGPRQGGRERRLRKIRGGFLEAFRSQHEEFDSISTQPSKRFVKMRTCCLVDSRLFQSPRNSSLMFAQIAEKLFFLFFPPRSASRLDSGLDSSAWAKTLIDGDAKEGRGEVVNANIKRLFSNLIKLR